MADEDIDIRVTTNFVTRGYERYQSTMRNVRGDARRLEQADREALASSGRRSAAARREEQEVKRLNTLLEQHTKLRQGLKYLEQEQARGRRATLEARQARDIDAETRAVQRHNQALRDYEALARKIVQVESEVGRLRERTGITGAPIDRPLESVGTAADFRRRRDTVLGLARRYDIGVQYVHPAASGMRYVPITHERDPHTAFIPQRFYRSPELTSVALHEIGHGRHDIFGMPGMADAGSRLRTLMREIRAWEFALRNVPRGDRPGGGEMMRGLTSYIDAATLKTRESLRRLATEERGSINLGGLFGRSGGAQAGARREISEVNRLLEEREKILNRINNTQQKIQRGTGGGIVRASQRPFLRAMADLRDLDRRLSAARETAARGGPGDLGLFARVRVGRAAQQASQRAEQERLVREADRLGKRVADAFQGHFRSLRGIGSFVTRETFTKEFETAATDLDRRMRRAGMGSLNFANALRAVERGERGAASEGGVLLRNIDGQDVATRRASRSVTLFERNLDKWVRTSGRANINGRQWISTLLLIAPPLIPTTLGLIAGGINAIGAAALAGASQIRDLVGGIGAVPLAASGIAQFRTTFTLAMADVGAAIDTSLNAPLQQFQTSIAALSEPARNFAIGVRERYRGPFQALKTSVQGPIFAGAQRGLAGLEPDYGVVRQGLTGTARVIGNTLGNLGQEFGRSPWRRDFARVTQNNIVLIKAASTAVIPLARALRDLVVASTPIVTTFARAALRLVQLTTEILNARKSTGALSASVQESRRVMTDLLQIAHNLADIFLELTRLAQPLGKSWLDQLTQITNGWARWVNSVRGRNEIRNYLDELVPAVNAVVKLFADLAKVIVSVGGNRSLQQLATGLDRKFLPVLQRVITQTEKAFGPKLVDLVTNVLTLLATLSAPNGPLGLLLNLINGLVSGINSLATRFPFFRQFIIFLAGALAAIKVLRIASVFSVLYALTNSWRQLGTTVSSSTGQQVAGIEAVTAALKAETITAEQAAAAISGLVAAPVGRGVMTNADLEARLRGTRGGVQPIGFFGRLRAGLRGEEGGSRFGRFLGAGARGLGPVLPIAATTIALGAGAAVGGRAGAILQTAGTGAGIGLVAGPEGALAGAAVGLVAGFLLTRRATDGLSRALGRAKDAANNFHTAGERIKTLRDRIVQDRAQVLESRQTYRQAVQYQRGLLTSALTQAREDKGAPLTAAEEQRIIRLTRKTLDYHAAVANVAATYRSWKNDAHNLGVEEDQLAEKRAYHARAFRAQYRNLNAEIAGASRVPVVSLGLGTDPSRSDIAAARAFRILPQLKELNRETPRANENLRRFIQAIIGYIETFHKLPTGRIKAEIYLNIIGEEKLAKAIRELRELRGPTRAQIQVDVHHHGGAQAYAEGEVQTVTAAVAAQRRATRTARANAAARQANAAAQGLTPGAGPLSIDEIIQRTLQGIQNGIALQIQRSQDRFNQMLERRNIDPGSVAGLRLAKAQDAHIKAMLQNELRLLANLMAAARRRHASQQDIQTIQDQINSVTDAIYQNATDAAVHARDLVNATFQRRVDVADFREQLAEIGLQRLQARQEIANTAQYGGPEQAAFIRGQILPRVHSEIKALNAQIKNSNLTADAKRQKQIDLANLHLKVLQLQAEALNDIRTNTGQIVAQGGITFEAGGQRWLEGALASGTGISLQTG